MNSYILAPEAERDLDAIKTFLVEKADIRVARYVLREIKAAVQFLVLAPEAGHLRKDLTLDTVKFWPVFSYLIVYNPKSQPLEIVRLLHGRRDVAAILEGEDDI